MLRERKSDCSTCRGRNRHTTDMVCMDCGRDYMPDDGSDVSAPGLGWKRLMLAWREQCKQIEAQRDSARDIAAALEAELAEAKAAKQVFFDRMMLAEVALARIEALCVQAEQEPIEVHLIAHAHSSPVHLCAVMVDNLRAAIAVDGLPAPAAPADLLTEAKIAHALAQVRANTAFMNRLAERVEADRELLDRLAGPVRE